MTTQAATMFPVTISSDSIRLSKPSLLRGRTTETSTTVAMSQITDEEESSSVYTMSQYDERANDDDFVIYSNINIDEDNVEFLDDADSDSIEELISATSRRWKQETAHLVRQTATGAQFPCSASALQDQRTHCLVPPSEQPQQQQEQYCYVGSGMPLSPYRHPVVPISSATAPPPVAVLDVRHTPIDDDDLTIDTAFMTSPTTSSSRRPTHDDTMCFR